VVIYDRQQYFFFDSPFYLQSVAVDSANVVKARRRVLTSTPLYLIGSESSSDLGSETYKLNLKNYFTFTFTFSLRLLYGLSMF
jgi:hypothetical protein